MVVGEGRRGVRLVYKVLARGDLNARERERERKAVVQPAVVPSPGWSRH